MSSLSLNVANSGTATYNLTSLGTQDWIVYPGSSPVRKSGGGSAISIGHVGSFTDSSASPTNDTATWSDGAGTTSGSTQNLIYSASGQGIGYSASFPADTSQRTATIIAGVYGTGLQVTASLSDGSAAQKVDTSLVWTSGGGVQALIQIAYSAASAGQTLNVSMVQTGGGTSNASFQAAAVTTGTAPTPTKVTVSPSAASGNVGSPVTLTIGTDVALTGSQNESVALSSDLAGSFSANPVSINASNPAITATFTPSAAGTATITGTPTGTPSIVAGTASYAANAQRVAVLYNDAAISYSPYNWDDRSGVKIANNTGAYARLAFTGTSINVGVDVSAMSASSLPAAQYPIVRTIIDGANFTDTQLTTGATSIPISGLANGAHTIEVLFLAAMTLTPDRWNTPVSAVRLTGFSLDNGASYSAPNARSKKIRSTSATQLPKDITRWARRRPLRKATVRCTRSCRRLRRRWTLNLGKSASALKAMRKLVRAMYRHSIPRIACTHPAGRAWLAGFCRRRPTTCLSSMVRTERLHKATYRRPSRTCAPSRRRPRFSSSCPREGLPARRLRQQCRQTRATRICF